jgi:flagellin-like protein
MNYRKFRRNVRAISPIIATLLLIAIAVVAALVTYAWVMGYIGFQTSNSGKSVVIQSVTDTPPTTIVVYIQNTGQSPVSFGPNSVYVNGVQWTTAAGSAGAGSTATLTATAPTGVTIASGQQVTIKVICTSGTYGQVTQALP